MTVLKLTTSDPYTCDSELSNMIWLYGNFRYQIYQSTFDYSQLERFI